jgi:hypothetical protein
MLNSADQLIFAPNILSLTALALDAAKSYRVIDCVTLVQGYSELSVMF